MQTKKRKIASEEGCCTHYTQIKIHCRFIAKDCVEIIANAKNYCQKEDVNETMTRHNYN